METARQKKFTRLEKSWIMYDWANSVYATNVLAVIFPIYFETVCKTAGVDNVVYWGYGTSIATLISAILAPLLGSIADHKGYKKKLFVVFLLIGVAFTFSNIFFTDYRLLLLGYVISHIGFSGSCLFYDSFLTDVTTNARMNRVSSWGYAMGYIGGSTIPFVGSIAILLSMGMNNPAAFQWVMMLTSLWWLIFSIPFLLHVKQTHYLEKPVSGMLKSSFRNLWHTMKDIFSLRHLLLFLLAYFFYIDGVGTVISISTSYGSKLGLDSVQMIFALLMTQIVAVPFSILFGKLADQYGSIQMLILAVGIYIIICITGFFMGFHIEQNPGDASALQLSTTLFWMMAFLVGTVQGGIQAISRSYFGRLIPKERSSEFFGFFDIFGKFAAVIGPAFISIFSQLTGRTSIGIISLIVLFAAGGGLLLRGRDYFAKAEQSLAAGK